MCYLSLTFDSLLGAIIALAVLPLPDLIGELCAHQSTAAAAATFSHEINRFVGAAYCAMMV